MDKKIVQPTVTDETDKGHFEDFIGSAYNDKSYAEQKFIALYKCRYLLARIGTMQERRIWGNKLKQMKRKVD